MVKSEIVKKAEKEPKPEWPKLMKAPSGLVVLFSRRHIGTVVVPNAMHEFTFYAENWFMDEFQPFTDKVVLENV